MMVEVPSRSSDPDLSCGRSARSLIACRTIRMNSQFFIGEEEEGGGGEGGGGGGGGEEEEKEGKKEDEFYFSKFVFFIKAELKSEDIFVLRRVRASILLTFSLVLMSFLPYLLYCQNISTTFIPT